MIENKISSYNKCWVVSLWLMFICLLTEEKFWTKIKCIVLNHKHLLHWTISLYLCFYRYNWKPRIMQHTSFHEWKTRKISYKKKRHLKIRKKKINKFVLRDLKKFHTRAVIYGSRFEFYFKISINVSLYNFFSFHLCIKNMDFFTNWFLSERKKLE